MDRIETSHVNGDAIHSSWVISSFLSRRLRCIGVTLNDISILLPMNVVHIPCLSHRPQSCLWQPFGLGMTSAKASVVPLGEEELKSGAFLDVCDTFDQLYGKEYFRRLLNERKV